MTEVNEHRAKLLALLTDLDLSPSEQGANAIRIMLDGLYATVLVYGDSTLSLVCSVRGNGHEWDLQSINAANNRVRFAKFSVDRGNLLLEADFVFNIGSSDAEDQLQQVLKLWRLAVRELRLLVEELVSA